VSTPLLQALVEQGSATILCGKNYLPLGLLLPVQGMQDAPVRTRAQLQATEALKNRLWRRMAASKIQHQAELLTFLDQKIVGNNLAWLAKNVSSGDQDNKEAQAARKYWPALLGEDFRRGDDTNELNSLLNYGYTILRSATARAIVATGLLPQFGIKHYGPHDAFALADDLMEPFRPLVDALVYSLKAIGKTKLTPETKQILAKVIILDMETSRGSSTVMSSLQQCTLSLSKSYLLKKDFLWLPENFKETFKSLLSA
jgi:CRISPR-associated protein Cas1